MGDGIVRIGRRRAARYGLPMAIAGIGAAWPVFTVNEAGEAEPLGQLYSLRRDQHWFEATIASRSLLTDGLPFVLQDLRLQGFIDRSVPKRYPELGLPQRIADWQASDVLTYLVHRGDDGIGNILVGDEALQRYLIQKGAQGTVIDSTTRRVKCQELVRAAIEGEIAGSSAGGEHPKFSCVVGKPDAARHVLVKFSPSGNDPVSRRWSDLLISEHLALAALTDAGLTASSTELCGGDGQVFMEAERFDRVGAIGRRGVVSLAAIDDALVGKRESWTSSVKSLRSLNRISTDDVDRVRKNATFGRLIGNTDMHFGNLSFYLSFAGQFALAPIYDMLPMRYAPTAANAISTRELAPPLPTGDSLDIWREMSAIAERYWRQVATHEWISSEFAMIAERNTEIAGAAARLA
jgi:HipA-like C-terminal domain